VLFAEEILSCFFGQYTAHCRFPPLHRFIYFLHQKNSSGLQHYPTAGVVRRRNLRFPSVQLFFPSCNEGIHLVYNTIPRPVLFAEEILSCFFGQYTLHCRFLSLHSFNFFSPQKNSSGLQHYPTAGVVHRRNPE